MVFAPSKLSVAPVQLQTTTTLLAPPVFSQ